MNRREFLKSILVGAAAVTLPITVSASTRPEMWIKVTGVDIDGNVFTEAIPIYKSSGVSETSFVRITGVEVGH